MGRLLDLVIIIVVVALGTYALRSQPPAEPPVASPPSPATAQPAAGHRPAPPFTATEVYGGKPFTYSGGPAFIVLTAVGCKDCRDRIPLDREAVDVARRSGFLVLNLLVFADADYGLTFAKRYNPPGTHTLADPGGTIGVDKYAGNDSRVWILVDRHGHIAWQGGPDLSTFRSRFSALQLESL